MAEVARRPWFPDFCRLPRIAAVLAIAELVVLIIALAPSRAGHWNANEFGAASAFALWLGLTIAIAYCKARPVIDRLPHAVALSAALLLPLVVGMLGAFAIQQIDLGLGMALTLPVSERWRFMLGVGGLATLISGLSLRYF